MSILKDYIKYRRAAVAVYLTATAVCFVTMPLYDLPEAAFYVWALTSFFTVIFSLFDFRRFGRRMKKLQYMVNDPSSFRDFMSEETLDPSEELTFAALSKLYEDYQALAGSSEENRRLTADYFTAWTHNIKTPIAAMYLLLENTDEDHRRALREQLFKTEQYVDMVMAYARLDSPTNDFLLRRFPLDDVIRRAVKKYATLFIGREISIDLPPTGLTVLSDEKWLGFVLEQLISNAVKYTPVGGRVTIYSPEPVKLVITDSGPGVPPEDLPRIWERGYTGQNGHGESRSSGMGLYLVGTILRRLGHPFSASSPPDCGLTVTIDLKTRDSVME